jgi:hypothetical protein
MFSAAEPLRPLVSVFNTGAATFSLMWLLIYPHEAEWTLLQTHRFSENVVASGIESGTSGCAARNSDHWNKQAVAKMVNWGYNNPVTIRPQTNYTDRTIAVTVVVSVEFCG